MNTLHDELMADLRRWLEAKEQADAVCPFRSFESDIDGRPFRLTLYLSPHLRQVLRRVPSGELRDVVKALRNARYGFDVRRGQSNRGKDGIFAVSRDHRPPNAMMRKLYDLFLDTDRGRAELKRHFADPDAAHGVRVVCHNLRLLGFIEVSECGGREQQKLVLVDVDATGKGC